MDGQRIRFCKSLKLKHAPTVLEMIDQLQLVQKRFDPVCRYEGDLDLNATFSHAIRGLAFVQMTEFEPPAVMRELVRDVARRMEADHLPPAVVNRGGSKKLEVETTSPTHGGEPRALYPLASRKSRFGGEQIVARSPKIRGQQSPRRYST